MPKVCQSAPDLRDIRFRTTSAHGTAPVAEPLNSIDCQHRSTPSGMCFCSRTIRFPPSFSSQGIQRHPSMIQAQDRRIGSLTMQNDAHNLSEWYICTSNGGAVNRATSASVSLCQLRFPLVTDRHSHERRSHDPSAVTIGRSAQFLRTFA